jgi:hypothetical protein
VTGEYTGRFGGGTQSSSKPECFGDLEAYDPNDETCQDCVMQRSCRIIVDRKMERDVATARERRGTTASTTTPTHRSGVTQRQDSRGVIPMKDEYREEPKEGDSILVAFVYNGVLSATESVLREAAYGVGSLPKIRYRTPLLMRRFFRD